MTFDQNGIAELVRSVAVRRHHPVRAPERGVVGEGAQHLVVTGARCVGARDDHIDDAQPARRIDALGRQAIAGPHVAVAESSVLERADDGGADRNHTALSYPRPVNGEGRRIGNAIGLVKGQAPVECVISCGRNARRVRDRGKGNAASEPRPANRTSIEAPVRACVPCRLAGKVVASLAITRSPGRSTLTNVVRDVWQIRPRASMINSFACGGRCSGRSAAIIDRSR